MLFSFLLISTVGGTYLSGKRNRKKEKFAAMAEKMQRGTQYLK
jgi:hypothetical protein